MTAPAPTPAVDDALGAAMAWQAEGRDVALATVVATWGSSPRQPGSQLAIDADGHFVGSVSGGCVEGQVVEAARAVLGGGDPQLLRFGVTNEMAWEVGLACGGTIEIFVQRAPARDALAALVADHAARRTVVAATWLDDGARRVLRIQEAPPDAPPDALVAAVTAQLAAGRSAQTTLDGRPVFLHLYPPRVRLAIVGAGHIAQAMCPIALQLGIAVTVIDPRGAFSTRRRFPDDAVALSSNWPQDALPVWAPDARSAVVVCTHDPKVDDPALTVALASDAFYIGALGSRKTHAARRERLAASGVTDAALARIDAPIGLDIGARTPAEIALSVMAALVLALRGPKGG